jgi:hypothetical protein
MVSVRAIAFEKALLGISKRICLEARKRWKERGLADRNAAGVKVFA